MFVPRYILRLAHEQDWDVCAFRWIHNRKAYGRQNQKNVSHIDAHGRQVSTRRSSRWPHSESSSSRDPRRGWCPWGAVRAVVDAARWLGTAFRSALRGRNAASRVVVEVTFNVVVLLHLAHCQ